MATLYTAWRADGNGQSQIASLRSDKRGFTKEGLVNWLKMQEGKRECVLITKGRTDRQSLWEHVLWQRPGYVDPTTQVRETRNGASRRWA